MVTPGALHAPCTQKHRNCTGVTAPGELHRSGDRNCKMHFRLSADLDFLPINHVQAIERYSCALAWLLFRST